MMTSPTGEIICNTRRTSNSGFSLIELILVLLLLSLSASMVSPMLGRFSHGRNANDAAAHLLAIMQYAQEQAIMTSNTYRLNFDTQTNSYWLSAAARGIDSRIASEIGRTFSLPMNLTLEVDGSEDLLANRFIQFDTDGGHDMAALKIINTQGNEILIACPSPSEPYRIGDPANLTEQDL